MARNLTGFKYKQLIAGVKSQGVYEAQAEEAFITLQGGEIRYTDVPDVVLSPIYGHVMYEGMSLVLSGVSQIENFRFVKASDREAILSVTLRKE